MPMVVTRNEPMGVAEQDDEEEEDEEEEDGAAAGEAGGAEDSQGSQSSELPARFPRIIKKMDNVMECLHRFCRECIDKSMRLGNNERPACRTHCASRRSLRDDTNDDSLIATLYSNIDKYEEEELAFHEEERNRNKQIRVSIAQILQRQA